jgi:hypothetical protein
MFVCEAVIQQWLLYIRFSRGRCPATGLHATLLLKICNIHKSMNTFGAYLNKYLKYIRLLRKYLSMDVNILSMITSAECFGKCTLCNFHPLFKFNNSSEE